MSSSGWGRRSGRLCLALWLLLVAIGSVSAFALTPPTPESATVLPSTWSRATYTYDSSKLLSHGPIVGRLAPGLSDQEPQVAAREGSAAIQGSGVAANAGTRSIDDLLRPGGSTIGKAGTDDTIREITGGLPEAQTMFQQLSQGGTVVARTPHLTRVELPNGGGFVQLRTLMSRSPNTAATIDVNIPGFDVTKLKYNP